MNLFFFGWPASVGGASTKMAHVLCLLAPHYSVTVVPPAAELLEDRPWRELLEGIGCRIALWEDLPARLDGWAVAMCYSAFLQKGLTLEAKKRGLRVAWSNDMMWHFPLELGTICGGGIDAVMYVSPAQRAALEPGYRRAMLAPEEMTQMGAWEGVITGSDGRVLRWVMTDNYIDPRWFPFRDRFQRGMKTSRLTVGRMSRADPAKFPDNFPALYEGLGLKRPRFRVMGWSDALAARFAGHDFGDRWELLPEAAENPAEFLHSLDLYVYHVGPHLRESWGRAVVEAMLTGAIPIIQGGAGHMEHLLVHGESGFVCRSAEEFAHYARMLQDDPELRRRMSLRAHEWSVSEWCRPEQHLKLWRALFETTKFSS